jgi:hypothetical protein
LAQESGEGPGESFSWGGSRKKKRVKTQNARMQKPKSLQQNLHPSPP